MENKETILNSRYIKKINELLFFEFDSDWISNQDKINSLSIMTLGKVVSYLSQVILKKRPDEINITEIENVLMKWELLKKSVVFRIHENSNKEKDFNPKIIKIYLSIWDKCSTERILLSDLIKRIRKIQNQLIN